MYNIRPYLLDPIMVQVMLIGYGDIIPGCQQYRMSNTECIIYYVIHETESWKSLSQVVLILALMKLCLNKNVLGRPWLDCNLRR